MRVLNETAVMLIMKNATNMNKHS